MAKAGTNATPTQAPTPQVGQLWGLPGITRPTEQPENNDQVSVTMSQTSQTDFIFAANFKQTDVMAFWQLEFNITQTYTAGTSTIQQSQYFPYSHVAQIILNFQNQFDTVNLTYGGIDAAIFTLLRPMRGRLDNSSGWFLDQNPAQNAYGVTQPNLQTANASAPYNTLSANVKFVIDLPASVQFDRYYECDPTGRPVEGPMRAIVSPQYMAGTNRIVQARVKMAAGSAATLDNAAANIGSGTGTFSGSAVLGIQRIGWYQPLGPGDSPRVFNWQYRRSATKFTLAGVSAADVVVPLQGQILGIFARFFDPSANSGVGAPLALSNVKNAYLQYGSGLFRYQDQPIRTQRRPEQKRNILLPEGVLWWDLALDEWNYVTNAYALNTMNTSGIQLHFDFTGTLSSTAYVVLGVEALTYVAML